MIIRRYTASWCGPCRSYGPLFDAVAKDPRFDLITFEIVDVDEQPAIATEFEVTNIPRTDVVMGGITIHARTGVMTKEELTACVEEALGNVGVTF